MADGESADGAESLQEKVRPSLRAPDRVAAGMHALVETLKFTARETGFVRGIKDWVRINKKDGFDCQSCAWPSPDENRHLFEFCENGVKALTSEATKKHIGLEFFPTSIQSPTCANKRTTGSNSRDG